MAWPPTTHQDVQDDLTDGHGSFASLVARLRVAEAMLPAPIIKSGRYFGASAYSTSSSVAVASGRLYLLPFYLPASTTFDRVTINVATATASTTGRCSVWTPDATTLLPSALAVDGGTVSGATTGLKETTISVTLAGLVYFGFVADGATWSGVTNAMVPNLFGSSSGSLGSNAMGVTTELGAGVTTLPSSLSSATFSYSGSTFPTGMLRAA